MTTRVKKETNIDREQQIGTLIVMNMQDGIIDVLLEVNNRIIMDKHYGDLPQGAIDYNSVQKWILDQLNQSKDCITGFVKDAVSKMGNGDYNIATEARDSIGDAELERSAATILLSAKLMFDFEPKEPMEFVTKVLTHPIPYMIASKVINDYHSVGGNVDD